MTAYSSKETESYWKYFFLLTAVICITLGVTITPDLLISLGPMRQTLTSADPSIQRVAHLELYIFRGMCIALGAIFFILSIKWRDIWNSKWIKHIRNHQVRETDKHIRIMTGWNPSLTVIIICLSLALLYIGFISQFLSDSLLRRINREDGLIEYASALIFFVSSIVSLVLSFKQSGQTSRVIVYRLFSFVFFLMAGEEISWGQRIIGIETLDIMKQVNVQAENNLHNLFGYFADHAFIGAIFMFGFVLPVLANRNLFIRKLCDFMGLPVASIGLAVGFLLISFVHDWTLYRIFDKVTSLRMAELRELLSSVALLLLMLESWLLTALPLAEKNGKETT